MIGYGENSVKLRASGENHSKFSSTYSVASGLSLRANFSWAFLGNVTYAGCQWGILVSLAKIGSPELVGQFALGLAITAPVYMAASLGLRNVQTADAKHDYSFSDYLSLRIITTILAMLGVIGIGILSNYQWEIVSVILAVGFCKAIESTSDIIFGLCQQRERMDRVAKSLILKGPLSLFTVSLVVSITGSVFWGIAGLGAVWVLIFLGYDIRSASLILKPIEKIGVVVGKQIKLGGVLNLTWEPGKLLKLAWLALPLGLAELAVSLQANIPCYFIKHHLGTSILGIFVALAYFDRTGKLVMHALGRSTTARLSQYYAKGNRAAFRSLLLKLVSVGVLLGGMGVLVALFAGEIILTLIYDSEYAIQEVFVTLMVAAALSYVANCLTCVAIASQYFRAQMFQNFIATSALCLLCILLIPSGGLQGAAKAVAIARGLEAGCAMAITAYSLLALRSRTRQREELQHLPITSNTAISP